MNKIRNDVANKVLCEEIQFKYKTAESQRIAAQAFQNIE